MPVVKRKVLVFCMTVLFSLSCAVTALASFQRGDDGQEVVAIQKRLVELSYSINNIDGDFGPETERAVKNFQADKGLEVDGIVGSATYRALMNREMPPNRSNSVVRNVLRSAYSVIGTPYVFGGTTPYGFDCSGFTSYVYKNTVCSIERVAQAQFDTTTRVSRDELLPGDLVFFGSSAYSISHVGIYVGDGQFIHAPHTGDVVKYDSLSGSYATRFQGGGRVIFD